MCQVGVCDAASRDRCGGRDVRAGTAGPRLHDAAADIYIDTYAAADIYIDTYAAADIYMDTYAAADIYIDTYRYLSVCR